MNKGAAIAGVVVLLGAAYVGTSWYVGQQAEARIRDGVAQASERVRGLLGADTAGKGFGLDIQEYRRGLFTSDAVYTLRFTDGDGEPVEVAFSDHLQHGPFPLSALKAGSFSPVLARSHTRLLPGTAVQTWFDNHTGTTPLQADTLIEFGGKGSSVWTFAPVEYAGQGDEFSFSGGVVSVDFSNQMADTVSKGEFASLHFFDSEDQQRLRLENILIDSTSASGNQDVRVSSRATIGSLAVSTEDSFTIENLAVTVDSRQQGPMLDGSVRYEADRLTAGEADLGGVDLTMGVRNLDLAALSDLNDAYDAMVAQRGEAAPGQTLDLTDEEEEQLLQKALTVLAKEPSLFLEPLAWRNSAGQTNGSLRIDLIEPSDLQIDSQDPLATVARAVKQLQLELDVSRPMFIQAFGQLQQGQNAAAMGQMGAMLFDQYVGAFEKAGLVRADGDRAIATVAYEDGVVTLNDASMPLDQFIMLLMLAGM